MPLAAGLTNIGSVTVSAADSSFRAPPLSDRELIAACLDRDDVGLLVVGIDGRIRGANALAQGLLRRRPEALLGQRWSSLVLQPQSSALPASMTREQRLRLGDGEEDCFLLRRHAASTHDGALTIIELTQPGDCNAAPDNAPAEQNDRLLASTRAITAGQVAAGLAHDLNNLLAVAMGGCERWAAGSQAAQHGQLARQTFEALRSATLLTGQLLDLARPDNDELETAINLSELVEDLHELLRRLAGSSIQLGVDCSASACLVRARRAHLEQILINLVVNAREAMLRGGDLTLRTAPLRVSERGAAHLGDIGVGDYVLLEVNDTGTGIEPEILTRIFDTGYSTKPGGCGLGLASVRRLVEQLGGTVRVRSEPGHGSAFRVLLPRETGDALEPRQDRTPPRSTSALLAR